MSRPSDSPSSSSRARRFLAAPLRAFDQGWFIWLLLGLYLLLRLLQCSSALMSLDDEDGFTVSSAAQLLGPQSWPWYAYQISDWEGGSLLNVLVAVPLVLLFGPSLFVTQITGLLWSIITLVGVYLVARDAFGVKVANLAGLLYCLAPPPILVFTMVAHGFHPDSAGFQLLFIWLLLRGLTREPTTRRLLICGVLGGFSVYYAYISAIVVLAGTLMLTVRLWRRRLLRRLLPYCLGGLLGATPLVVTNIAADGLGLMRTLPTSGAEQRTFADYVSPAGCAVRVEHFAETGRDPLLYFTNFNEHGEKSPAVNLVLWSVLVLVLVAPWLWRRRFPATDLDRLALLVAGLTVYVIVNSGHPIRPNHLVPLVVLLLVPAAGRAVALWDGRTRWLGPALLAPLAVAAFATLGVWQNTRAMDPGRIGLSLAVDARNDGQFLQQMKLKYRSRLMDAENKDIDRRIVSMPLDRLRVVPAGERLYSPLVFFASDFASVVAGIVTQHPHGTLYQNMLWDGALARLRHKVGQMQRVGWPPHTFMGVGMTLAMAPGAAGLATGVLPAATRKIFDSLRGPEKGAALEGFGMALPPGLIRKYSEQRSCGFSRDELSTLARGKGRQVNLVDMVARPEPPCEMMMIPEFLHEAYFEGIGAGFRCRLVREPPQRILRTICPSMQAAFWRGWKTSACVDSGLGTTIPR